MTLPSQMDCQQLEQQAWALAALCQDARSRHADLEAQELENKLDDLLVQLTLRCEA